MIHIVIMIVKIVVKIVYRVEVVSGVVVVRVVARCCPELKLSTHFVPPELKLSTHFFVKMVVVRCRCHRSEGSERLHPEECAHTLAAK